MSPETLQRITLEQLTGLAQCHQLGRTAVHDREQAIQIRVIADRRRFWLIPFTGLPSMTTA